MIRRLLPLFFLVLAAAAAAIPDRASGCAVSPRTGESVDVSDEVALIIWDASKQTEHFIRQATFVGSAYDFGFLVPTPSRPEIKEASADIFAELAHITEAKTEHQTISGLNLGCSGSAGGTANKSDEAPMPGGVVVLEQGRVGELNYSSLTFRGDLPDPDERAFEVIGWLNRHQYAASPEIKDWLKKYIRDNWVITAFRIATPQGQPPQDGKPGVAVKSTTVRMSFKTERPFFPYREPVRNDAAEAAPRLLRLFVAARQKMDGKIGGDTHWPGQVVWSNKITDQEKSSLLQKADLPATTLADRWWLTEYEDRSSPRPATDELYLARSADTSPVIRPARLIIQYRTAWWVGPLGLIALVVLCMMGFYVIRRTAGASAADERPAGPPPPADSTQSPPPLPEAPAAKSGPAKTDPRRWS